MAGTGGWVSGSEVDSPSVASGLTSSSVMLYAGVSKSRSPCSSAANGSSGAVSTGSSGSTGSGRIAAGGGSAKIASTMGGVGPSPLSDSQQLVEIDRRELRLARRSSGCFSGSDGGRFGAARLADAQLGTLCDRRWMHGCGGLPPTPQAMQRERRRRPQACSPEAPGVPAGAMGDAASRDAADRISLSACASDSPGVAGRLAAPPSSRLIWLTVSSSSRSWRASGNARR